MTKTGLIGKTLWSLLLALSISGCNNVSRQRSLAIEAIKDLERTFNNRECGMIYDGGAIHFRSNQRREEWIAKCNNLRDRLGPWRSFAPETNNSWPIGEIGVVWVEGQAGFEKGSCRVRADWALKGDHAELFNLQVEGNGEKVDIPGFSGRFR